MSLPDVTVEIAFDSGFSTAEGDRTWTDVTAYVEGDESIDITYGRSDELATPEPNACTVTLDNRDGRFTPEKTSSPYYPEVKKGKPLRVTVTYNAVDYVRFTGYIDEWPLVWPDGSSSASTITITATSRRARLGHTAALKYSPIRYAYAEPDWPQAYWPMDGTRITRGGEEVFIDVTNLGTPIEVTESRLFVYTSTAALQPVFDRSTPGPIDESELLKFPSFSDFGLVSEKAHYVGSSAACEVNTAGELTLELVARIDAPVNDDCFIRLAYLTSPRSLQTMAIHIENQPTAGRGLLSLVMSLYDDDTTTNLAYAHTGVTYGFTPELFEAVNDGELHHYAFTLTGQETGSFYVDGELIHDIDLTPAGTYFFDQPFTQLILGMDTWKAPAWIGHVAVRDEALTAGEIAAHAAAATTIDETVEERLQRLAGYVGVPAAEVEAEDTVAIDVGDQSQKDRAPIEVADELAASTAGVLYDSRNGHLVMQARNHRYNQTAAFTLNATTQEVGGDLTAVLDDQKLVNFVTVSRVDVDDLAYEVSRQASIEAYGTYSTSIDMVTTSWDEAISAASHALARYAEPDVRISTVAVDVVNLSTSQQAAVLNADIGTLFNISSLPAQAPTDPMPLYLEGYTENITSTSHTVTMNTTPGDWFTNVAVLDDASHDQLDSGITLAY